MHRWTVSTLAAAVSLSLALPGVTLASQEEKAEALCKAKIQSVYGVSDMRQVWGEKVGHHKFKIHGRVKVDHQKYPFDCKIKNGQVKSYSYDGPHPHHGQRHHKDHDDDSNLGTVLAVGAGLAIVAALASQSSDDDSSKSSSLPVQKSVLEDDCHDMLQYRIRDEHDYTARVHINSSNIKGHDLVGQAKVKYERKHAQRASFTCHFDHKGRLKDSSYHLY
jgi:hypothetical protein